MTGKTMRDNPLFMRNNFDTVGKWGIPLIRKQDLPTDNIMLVACSDTRANDNEENKKKVYISSLTIIVSQGFMIILKEHSQDILNMIFCFLPTSPHMQICRYGDSLKALQKIVG